MSKTKKFKTEVKPKPVKKNDGIKVSKSAVGLFLMSIGVVTFMTVKSVSFYKEINPNMDAIVFAKENPELVRDMKQKYDSGLETLKQDIVSPKE